MDELTTLNTAQLEQLLAQKRCEERKAAELQRKDYETARADFVTRVAARSCDLADSARRFYNFVVAETTLFRKVMTEYGQIRRNDQRSFTAQHDDFRIEVRNAKLKRFDERADAAACRLIEFLRTWIQDRQSGRDDPMYQLAMTLLERNKNGDLDYKSISKLYDLETRFGSREYSAIMQLFKESNVVEGTAINFYFYRRDERGIRHKIEPSFNRM